MFCKLHRIFLVTLLLLCLSSIAQAQSVANMYPKAIEEALSKEAQRSQDISQNGRKRIALVVLGNDDLMLDKNTMKAIDLLIKEQYRPYHYEVVRSKTFVGDCISFVEEHEYRNPIDIPKGFSYKDHINYLSVADYCRFARDLDYDYIFIFDMNLVKASSKGFIIYWRKEYDMRIASKIIDVKAEKYLYRAENVRRGESYSKFIIPGPSGKRAIRRAILEEIGIVLRDIKPLVH